MKIAVTGADARFDHLKELFLADGHKLCAPEEAEFIVSPPWERSARYTRSESYLIANAGLTAEGAAELLRREVAPGERVLVLGFGRVGALCAAVFSRSGYRVTVAARHAEQRAWASALGYEAATISDAVAALGDYAAVVNTVPSPLVDENALKTVRRDVYLLELASPPGGIDAACAKERGLRYHRAAGLPAAYAPERAAAILRDAVYETANAPKLRLGIALTGSHCSFDAVLSALPALAAEYDAVPILSEAAAETDTYFGLASHYRAELERICGKKSVDSIPLAEPLGAKTPLDALLVVPCTGNTLAKLANGVTDTPVTMACKAHLRNGRPLILAISTNDGLAGSAGNIAALLQRKNVYFVPFRQDAPDGKPYSLQSDFTRLGDTVREALCGRQLQPVLTGR